MNLLYRCETRMQNKFRIVDEVDFHDCFSLFQSQEM